MGVQLGGKVIGAGLRGCGCGAGTGGQQREVVTVLSLMIKRRAAAAAVRPCVRPGPGSPPSSFPQVTCLDRSGRPVLPPLFAGEMRARPALAVLVWTGDGFPVWGCTTTSGDQVPPRTLFRNCYLNWHKEYIVWKWLCAREGPSQRSDPARHIPLTTGKSAGQPSSGRFGTPHAGARRRHTDRRGGRYFSSRTACPLSFRSSAITPRNLPVGKSKARTWSWPTQ